MESAMSPQSLLCRVLVMALMCLFGVSARAAEEKKIVGNYAVKGTNPDGKEYKGTAEITKDGDAYYVKWTIGKESHVGVGILDGDKLSVCWLVGEGGSGLGIVVYKVNKDGKLVGKWVAMGRKDLLEETLTPEK